VDWHAVYALPEDAANMASSPGLAIAKTGTPVLRLFLHTKYATFTIAHMPQGGTEPSPAGSTHAYHLDKPHLWKDDVAKSVDMYNDWFMHFAPAAFRQTRVRVTGEVESALATTDFLRTITPAMLRAHPGILPTLRMSTCPPIAVDRLIGLAGVSKNLVKCMEDGQKLPPRMPATQAEVQLEKIAAIITRMADPDIFVWLGSGQKPDQHLTHRAATIT